MEWGDTKQDTFATQRPVDLDSASPGGTRAKWEAVPKSTLEINKTTKKQ